MSLFQVSCCMAMCCSNALCVFNIQISGKNLVENCTDSQLNILVLVRYMHS